ncbi:hypothetical protein NIES4071_10270 [Calothrix sp. NIES-4071]|nr:hypothetical protein NIES4071_10270 [Calothrix sp. NIES-4071]BAZ55368.1 hypothetical protein NIES4105_10230 [Calothrix sp. NIES-4105]
MTKTYENEEISQEYANFLNHYQHFLKHYNHCNEITVTLKYIVSKKTYTLRLFEEALQAHINATDAYRRTIQAHQELTQKVLRDLIKGID